MCGIFGIYTRNREKLERRARATLALIKHRGPDSQRLVFSGLNSRERKRYFGALGAARLAMVDVNGPNQPLETADQRYRIAFHGEIWNHKELRRELESKGASFRTAGDTEVVLYAVAQDGSKAPDTFRGQFAYIVEDTEKGLIHAGRDSHGICPLYYGQNETGEFILGSTVQVLLKNSVPGKGIKILPQGYTATYDTGTGSLEFARYYDITSKLHSGVQTPPIDDLRNTLIEVIKERIPQEVVYATIVGGMDSSLVTAVCGTSGRPPSCIITVATTEDVDSADVNNARLLSKELGIELKVGIVDEGYIRDSLGRVVNALGSANYYGVVTGIVGLKAAEMARAMGAKAIITGGGSDEIFGGYDFAWNMSTLDYLENNLLHIYQQSGIFECHREDGVTAAVGVESRPAYYDRKLAELVFRIPVHKRIVGLGTDKINEKAILKQLAGDYLPATIVNKKKSPFYRSTSIVQLFEKVASKLITPEETVSWKRQVVNENPSWLNLLFMPGRGPILVHKTFTEQFPGLAKLSIPYGPPDYNDPDSYGRYYGAFGSPLMEGYKWFQMASLKW